MPKVEWDDLERIKHEMSRVRQYHADTIIRFKILLDSIKEMQETLEKLILEAKED